jgi:diguanylate cyclase (GGDEF)-like protein/PAS domain S-box-containing protein
MASWGHRKRVSKSGEHDVVVLLRAVLRQGATYVGLLIIGLVWLGLDFHLASEREHAERAAVQSSRNLARAFEEHLSRSLKDIDRTLLILRANYENNPASFDFKGFLQTAHVSDHPAMQVVLIGSNGDVLMRSVGPVDPLVNVNDRLHFRHLSSSGVDELVISEPVVGRGTKKLSVHLSRPVRKADGSFDGILTVTLDPQYFAKFFQSIDIGRDGYVTVVGSDGIVRAVGGAPSNLIGANLTGAELFKRHASAPAGWYYDNEEQADGVKRLKAYRAVKDFPLIVTVGIAAHEIFADTQFRRRAYRLIGSLFTLMILFVTGYSVWSRVKLEQTSEELQTQNLRFDAALNNMSHGLCMFDATGRLVVCNERYLELYGLSPENARPGTSLLELLEHRKAAGTFTADADRYIANLRAQIAEGKANTVTVELPDGRVIAVLNSPMAGGGWVALHEDITEQRRAELDLARTKNFLDNVIENVPATIIVKDAHDFRYVLINHAGEEFFGRPAHEVIGKTPYEILPKAAADSLAARDYELLSVGSQEFYHEPPLHKQGGMQLVSTRRRVIRGPNGEPRYLLSVVEDMTEQKRAEARIQHMAHHDALTDLPNRMSLMVKINEALARLRQRGECFSIFLLDLDQFKSVNDSLGHLVGDVLLKAVAQRLIACTRETDVVARLGGDEFAILQAVDGNPRDATAALAKEIVDVITAPYDLDGQQVVIGTSIGVAIAPDDGRDANELLIRADLALYRAKSEGRNGCRYFEPAMEAEVRARHALESNLRLAVARNEFELHYQTQVDIATQQTDGVEALVRWRHPQLGMVRPDQFIHVAEETGLIVPLGTWILRKACNDAAGWPSHISVAVNLSPAQFRRGDLIKTVADALCESGLPPERLQLEITETVLLQKNAENLAVLHELKKLGVSIVLDDFGTGYSSLSYLKMFPFDKIKIDRSFVAEMDDRADCAAIVGCVIALGRSLGMGTVAEGVETAEQVQLLRAAGCREAQGYLFSRPVPAADLVFTRGRRKRIA